jgi:predicted HTH domain antitoxin
MDSVDLQLPRDLVSAAKLNDGNLSHEAAKLIALELFREGDISIGRAAELSRTPLAAFLDFARSHGVTPLNYDLEQLEEDARTLKNLRA